MAALFVVLVFVSLVAFERAKASFVIEHERGHSTDIAAQAADLLVRALEMLFQSLEALLVFFLVVAMDLGEELYRVSKRLYAFIDAHDGIVLMLAGLIGMYAYGLMPAIFNLIRYMLLLAVT